MEKVDDEIERRLQALDAPFVNRCYLKQYGIAARLTMGEDGMPRCAFTMGYDDLAGLYSLIGDVLKARAAAADQPVPKPAKAAPKRRRTH